MRKRYLFGLLLTILALGMVFTGCDLFTLPGGEKYDPMTITGRDSEGESVKIVFSTTRTVPKATTMTPQENDTYSIYYKPDTKLVSTGRITNAVKESGATRLTLKSSNSEEFQANLTTTAGSPALEFPNGIPITGGGSIEDFKTDTGSNPNNSAAKEIVERLGSGNAAVNSAGNVEINKTVTVDKNLDVPAGVKLIFNAAKASFIINGGVSVTVKDGIEVRAGKEVTITQGNGKGWLIVGGSSAISGKLTVDDGGTLEIKKIDGDAAKLTIRGGSLTVEGGGTLDMFGDVVIESGGQLSISGEKTKAEVFNLRPDIKDSNPDKKIDTAKLKDGILTAGENVSLIVKNGGRFYMPDPLCFDISKIAANIEVEAGGEMILITIQPYKTTDKDTTLKERMHPLIGTETTMIERSQIGADYVMTPGDGSKITAKIVPNEGIPSDKKYFPSLELTTGTAVALGHYTPDDAGQPEPKRADVYVTIPFTVASGSTLQVGNTTRMYSSLLVIGKNSGFTNALTAGRLTIKGTILVFEKSGIWCISNAECEGSNRILRQADRTVIEEETEDIHKWWNGGGWPRGWPWPTP